MRAEMKTTAHDKGLLELEDGSTFEGATTSKTWSMSHCVAGVSFGSSSTQSVLGELVFQTGMVGYPESLTDPSYRGQILVLTYPLIGNYGVPSSLRDEEGLLRYFESERIHVTALIIAHYSDQPSHWNSVKTLATWLQEHNIPALYGVDTRRLVKLIRERGSLRARVTIAPSDSIPRQPWTNLSSVPLVPLVSTKEVRFFGANNKGPRVIVIDCGVKNNQLRELLRVGCRVKLVPWDYPVAQEPVDSYDGVFISNGPGDPALCQETIGNIRQLLQVRTPWHYAVR